MHSRTNWWNVIKSKLFLGGAATTAAGMAGEAVIPAAVAGSGGVATGAGAAAVSTGMVISQLAVYGGFLMMGVAVVKGIVEGALDEKHIIERERLKAAEELTKRSQQAVAVG